MTLERELAREFVKRLVHRIRTKYFIFGFAAGVMITCVIFLLTNII